MKINIPIPCPKCSGKMSVVSHEPILAILKQRSWQVCNECDYEIDTEKFKSALFTI